MFYDDEQSPGSTECNSSILKHAWAFWDWYEGIRKTPAGTHVGVVLEGLYAEYRDFLSREPIDLNRVGSLTAEALLLLTGKKY